MNPEQINLQNNTPNTAKTTPKDFFIHLASTIVLYISVISIINLLFSIINYFFPDSLSGYFYTSSIAWPISMLVVLVPILYSLEYIIKKDIRLNPSKSEIWINRWRIYLTLFLTGAVIAGDLIALINTYLNGEITARFIYKFLAILIVLGIVFSYYILEKLNTRGKAKSLLSYAGILLVIISIILGFIAVGSPNKQRSIKFDNQRINDLQNIQYQIINYWQQKGKLPDTLNDMKDSISGNAIPDDPDNNSAYEYKKKDSNKFELCAVFSLATQDIEGKGKYNYRQPYYFGTEFNNSNENWKHIAGKACFERTIDIEKYPINKRQLP